MNGKCCLASLVVVFAFVITGTAQSKRLGRVEVIMPQTAPEMPGFSPEIEKFTIYAISGKKKYKLNRRSRESYSGPNYIFVARYQKDLPPGQYTLSIKDNQDYLLPSFQLEAGKTYTINVPIARLPLSGYACFGGIMLENSENDPDGKPIKAEIFVTGGPFDISVHFCSSERSKDMVVYKPASIYYRDYYIVADEIKINFANRTVTASDTEETIVLRNGVFVDNTGKTFSLKF